MLLSRVRKLIDSQLPFAGHLYRQLREIGDARPRQTKHGFTLAGAPGMTGEYESSERDLFIDLLESHDVVIDIGANVGFYSCLAASHGKHVLAVEPSPRNLAHLYTNLWDNDFRKTEVFPLGLGPRRELRKIFGFGGISSFVAGWGQARESRFSIVPVTTLDSILGSRFDGMRLLIKMDVEGFELEILKGAKETLGRNPRPAWMIEIMLRDPLIPEGVNPKFRDTFDLFWDADYQCKTLDGYRSAVSKDHISKWVSIGQVERGVGSFLFY